MNEFAECVICGLEMDEQEEFCQMCFDTLENGDDGLSGEEIDAVYDLVGER